MKHPLGSWARVSLVLAALFCGGALAACGSSGPVDAPGSHRDGGALADGGGAIVDGGVVLADAGIPNTSAITFVVSVPTGTPFYEGVFMSGSQPVLGTWDGRGSVLTARADGRWSSTLRLPNSVATEYKMTRGNWETVEKTANGGERANRSVTPTGDATVDVTVERWIDQPNVTGRVERLGSFHSQFLPDDRPVLVYLPPAYDANPTTRYPVLYMHDGQNLFDRRTSFQMGPEWQVDETAERLIVAGEIAPLIIVAVGNTGARIDEYTQIASAGRGGGKADLYARLLVEELKPRIDSTYRTQPEPQFTGVAGSSLGGLVSMYFGLTKSATFTRIGVISPSVWWANRDILTRVNALTAKPPLRVWVDIGSNEGDQDTVPDARALKTALVAKGFVEENDLKYREYTNAAHNESSWAARFADVLKYLFPPQ